MENDSAILLPSCNGHSPPSVSRWIRDWTETQCHWTRKVLITQTQRGLIPYDCKFKITYRCNANCKMCLHAIKLVTDDTLKSKEMSDFEIKSLIPELAQNGCRSLHFSGGEPFLRDGLEKFVKIAGKQGIRTKITTNGTLVTTKRATMLAQAKLRTVNISLDGPNAKIHDNMRGVPGFFDRTINGIQELIQVRKKYGRPRVRINTVISHENYASISALLDLAEELTVDAVHLLPVDYNHVDPQLKLTRDDCDNLREILSNYRQKTRLLGSSKQFLDSLLQDKTKEYFTKGEYAQGYYELHPCFAPFLHLFIMPEGNVYPCCIVERTEKNCLGNVRYRTLREIWNDTPFQKLRVQALCKPLFNACRLCDHFIEINQSVSNKTKVTDYLTEKSQE